MEITKGLDSSNSCGAGRRPDLARRVLFACWNLRAQGQFPRYEVSSNPTREAARLCIIVLTRSPGG